MADDKSIGYGKGGVRGDRLSIRGYETKTVGSAGNVKHRLNVQMGNMSNDPNMVAHREPIRVGRFIIKWLKYPPFFHEKMKEQMRFLLEDNVKEVGGVPENSIETFDTENGSIKQTTTYPGMYKQGGGKMTLKVPEFAGSPLRKLLQYWIWGISDPKTGIMHLWGNRMRGVLPNYAGSFIYIVLGPTCRPDDIEFSCMLHECFPSAEKTGHFNTALGEVGSGVEPDIEFSGIYDQGPHIDALAINVATGFGLWNEDYLQSRLPGYLYKYLRMSTDELRAEFGGDIATRINDESIQEFYDDAAKQAHEEFIDTDFQEPIPDDIKEQIS